MIQGPPQYFYEICPKRFLHGFKDFKDLKIFCNYSGTPKFPKGIYVYSIYFTISTQSRRDFMLEKVFLHKIPSGLG
jgi:hypothetical protein